MSKHIGALIRKSLEDHGMSVSEFARRVNISRENAYSIFRRKTIDTGLLLKISKTLDTDFFAILSGEMFQGAGVTDKNLTYKKKKNSTLTDLLKDQVEELKEEISLLKDKIRMQEKIIQLLEEKNS